MIKGVDSPEWMDEASLATLSRGYMFEGETPKQAMRGIADKVGEYMDNKSVADRLFEYIWKGWVCPSTPVWSNFRLKRGASISCFNSHVEDSIDSIGWTHSEVMKMTQLGGGTSVYWGDVRARGSLITGGGKTNGSVSFMEMYDTMINKVSQGGVRRGATAMYLPIDHGDIEEFLQIKDAGNPIQNLFTGVCVDDAFIDRLYEGDHYSLSVWAKVLKSRSEKGIPYIFFTDNVNNHVSTPDWYGYKQNNPDYYIKSSNLCTEICEPSNEDESFVCCVSSMNVAKYDEWKDTPAVEHAIFMLDAVTEDFIRKTNSVKLMKRANKFAKNHRALGLGVLGWHTYLQQKDLPFASIPSKALNKKIFQDIRGQAEDATNKLGKKFGPCKIGDGARRNSTLMAPAPTVSNSTIQGGISPGIEPFSSNYFVQKSAKGNFIRKNTILEKLLTSLGKNTDEVWDSINKKNGSVQHLDFLDQHQKEVFKTHAEINQFGIIEQAADRQLFIDQSQSLNINIPPNVDVSTISKLHLYAHEKGIKTLYYQRGESILNSVDSMDSSCLFCEG